MKGVLVTHADTPLGERIALELARDEGVKRLVLVGAGAEPLRLEHELELAGATATWVTARLSQHRSAARVFHSEAAAQVEAVVHVPAHGAPDEAPGPAGVPARTTEARLVLQHCRETPSVKRLIALGSAYVYRLLPGNANRLSEEHELDLDPEVPASLRPWIDCDMMFREEAAEGRLRVALLRVPAVMMADGAIQLSPALEGSGGWRPRPAGFDPLCAVVAGDDVARAVHAALRARSQGAFNVAGEECLPLSILERWTGRTGLPIPGPLLRAAGTALRLVGSDGPAGGLDAPHLRYGFSLDTSRAASELNFQPRWRVGLSRGGEGVLRMESR